MCVFCEIIKGNIPSKKIYEDDKVLAILDISQATKLHTLVMPKEHYENIFDIDSDTLAHLIKVVKMIANHYKEMNPEILGINLLNNNNEAAGQSVMHYHMHILPRYKNDNLKIEFTDNSASIDLAELENQYKIKIS